MTEGSLSFPQLQIVTFYGYKGGTGRTLALANVARYLAEEQGYRVGLIDLDVESPGLPFQPLSRSMDDPGSAAEIRSGFIDKAQGFMSIFCGLDRSQDPPSDDDFTDLDQPVTSVRADLEIETPTQDDPFDVVELAAGPGAIFLMPAGPHSASDASSPARLPPRSGAGAEHGRAENSSYRSKLKNFHRRVADLSDENRAVRTLQIIRRFAKDCDLDLVFLDGRTGEGSFFQTYAYWMPHLLVLFSGLNRQNIAGILHVLKAAPKGEASSRALIVGSPEPFADLDRQARRRQEFAKDIKEASADAQETGEALFRPFPDEVSLYIPYTEVATYEETYFLGRYPQSAIAQSYKRLADLILRQLDEDRFDRRSIDCALESKSSLGGRLKAVSMVRA